ncbi:FAD:protein FMN transferase [Thiohalophilus sp.]|uniref:FAD:protein FMN transferase n=1 Tax=Thiohalophilus sp. TaxID=3028392 RepID=UPI002ACDD36B|nr:FAD:protein FMN transferase [Thiohalophilus sp.]MDZ7803276.1 FAD:protein FMN transferase [Thiohalophilus sp.]
MAGFSAIQSAMSHDLQFKSGPGFRSAHFQAMASPCELLLDSDDPALVEQLARTAQDEALRIERKFSRYRDDNIIHRINHARGQPVSVDPETAALLEYADHCYRISDGLFDITSGVLRRVWHFDGSDRVPDAEVVETARQAIGWPRVDWHPPAIRLPEGMEIDLGGIGKEYAVDRTAQLLAQQTGASFLINYGGDLYVNRPRQNGHGWIIGVEQPGQHTDSGDINLASAAGESFELQQGGVATSGDARRFLLKDGVRYSHILNPLTGWPVWDAPHSITVLAGTCTDAGILATLAMLQGAGAEAFLDAQQVKYWALR